MKTERKPWTQEEVDYVISARHALVPLGLIAEKINRTRGSVALFCNNLTRHHGELFPNYTWGRSNKKIWLSPAEKAAKNK